MNCAAVWCLSKRAIINPYDLTLFGAMNVRVSSPTTNTRFNLGVDTPPATVAAWAEQLPVPVIILSATPDTVARCACGVPDPLITVNPTCPVPPTAPSFADGVPVPVIILVAVPATELICACNDPVPVMVRVAVPDTVAAWACGVPDPVTSDPTCPVPATVAD